MPSFDVVSEVDLQEVRTRSTRPAGSCTRDSTSRVLTRRSSWEAGRSGWSSTEDRLKAVRQVLEEKLVRRNVSLKAIDYGKVEEASGGTARQTAKIVAGISSEKAREVNKKIKETAPKGIQSQTQGEQVRVTGKKRTTSKP